MYKSIIFGLFLVASLLLGTAVANMQMFSNAVAQEYGQHDNRYQQSTYEMDSYEQSYDDSFIYDKQPSYDKSSYNDDEDKKSYNYDDIYSKHPTKDKKYVCPTGQFEGFFVESLEFCKLNIPAGPEEPEGPAGQIDFTNTYLVVGTGASTGETPSRAFSVASCDPGDIVLEGGGGVASFFDEGLGNVFLLIREPINEGNGYWVGGVAANTGFDSSAICIDNPPIHH